MSRFLSAKGRLPKAFTNGSSLVVKMFSNRRCGISRSVVLTGIVSAVLAAPDRLLAGDQVFQGQVLNFQQNEIYHSPQTPGYTAWVGLWQLPNGTIQCDFAQGTGPQTNPVLNYPLLQSTGNGRNWTNLGPNNGYSRGVAVLSDGTMVRPAETDKFGPYDSYPNGIFQRTRNFFGVQRSTDGGKTWGQPIDLVSPTDYQLCWPTVVKPLKDGRLVAFAGLVANGIPTNKLQANVAKTMFVSSDKGLSWFCADYTDASLDRGLRGERFCRVVQRRPDVYLSGRTLLRRRRLHQQ